MGIVPIAHYNGEDIAPIAHCDYTLIISIADHDIDGQYVSYPFPISVLMRNVSCPLPITTVMGNGSDHYDLNQQYVSHSWEYVSLMVWEYVSSSLLITRLMGHLCRAHAHYATNE